MRVVQPNAAVRTSGNSFISCSANDAEGSPITHRRWQRFECIGGSLTRGMGIFWDLIVIISSAA